MSELHNHPSTELRPGLSHGLAEFEAPITLPSPDFKGVIALCEKQIKGYAKSAGSTLVKDFEHFIAEEVLMAIYGPKVYEWINKQRK